MGSSPTLVSKKNDMESVLIFKQRMQRLGIECVFSCNYPWVYLDSVDGNIVREKNMSKYKYTIGFLPVRSDQHFEFEDIGALFKIIRKYKKNKF